MAQQLARHFWKSALVFIKPCSLSTQKRDWRSRELTSSDEIKGQAMRRTPPLPQRPGPWLSEWWPRRTCSELASRSHHLLSALLWQPDSLVTCPSAISCPWAPTPCLLEVQVSIQISGRVAELNGQTSPPPSVLPSLPSCFHPALQRRQLPH